jgi:hypothetical protein
MVYCGPLALVLVGFALTTQTTYGIGITMLHNGTSVPDLSDAPPGTKVTNFTQFTNATGTYSSASFNVGPKPSNESSANTTDNQTDPSNTTANANEASYKWGYNYAFSRYHNCQISPNDCSVLLATDATYYCRDDQNSTACTDGYVDGWKDWCQSDTDTCVKYVLSGQFPGGVIHLKRPHDILRNEYGTVWVKLRPPY